MQQIDLYPRQQKALANLRSGSILCGGVGSGKSRTALAYYFLHEQGKDLYIITTAKKRDSLEWEGEISACGDVDTSRMGVHIDSWNNIQKYRDVSGGFFIFDEQRVVGSGAWARSFIKIAKRNDWLLLTATPGDNWSDYIPVFIANGFYKNRSEFLSRHAIFARYAKFPKIERWVDTKRLVRLRKEILVMMEYERPTEHKVLAVNTGYLETQYKDILKKRFDEEKNEPISSPGRLCYLLRNCSNNALKLVELGKRVEKRKKAIIFYNYDQELRFISDWLSMQNIDIACWNGHTHDPIPTSDRWVYLVQYNAGAEGWNCIETNCIIFYSLNYSYKMMLQASGRIDRCNTPFGTLYYYVFTNDSPIEQCIRECLRNKEKFNEKAFAEGLKNEEK